MNEDLSNWGLLKFEQSELRNTMLVRTIFSSNGIMRRWNWCTITWMWRWIAFMCVCLEIFGCGMTWICELMFGDELHILWMDNLWTSFFFYKIIGAGYKLRTDMYYTVLLLHRCRLVLITVHIGLRGHPLFAGSLKEPVPIIPLRCQLILIGAGVETDINRPFRTNSYGNSPFRFTDQRNVS